MPRNSHSVRDGVFEKVRLSPEQMRSVADKRFGDARCLLEGGNNRTNGAMYLGGFVIECLLKAAMLDKYVWLQRARSPEGHNGAGAKQWNLVYRWHDLDEILQHLPETIDRLRKEKSDRVVQSLKSICQQWTIYVRYSPKQVSKAVAAQFLGRVQELKRCLR